MTVIGIDPSFRACGVSDGSRHLVIKTEKGDASATQADDLIRRCREIITEIVLFVAGHHPDRRIVFYIEGPAFGQVRDASHLYELGWLMSAIHDLTRDVADRVVEVNTSTLRKWATGKGNTPKDSMKLAVYKKFGIEFQDDPGCDKLFAYLLSKYGEAVERGQIKPADPVKRGDKRRKKAAV